MAVLFGLMSLSLLSFGVPGMTSIGQQNAALVGDYKVTATELDQEFSLELQEEMRRTGTFINRMDALEQGKLEESLARLIGPNVQLHHLVGRPCLRNPGP